LDGALEQSSTTFLMYCHSRGAYRSHFAATAKNHSHYLTTFFGPEDAHIAGRHELGELG